MAGNSRIGLTRPRAILILALAAFVGGTSWLMLRRGFAQHARPPVILISIDTCRADHLGCYGGSGQTTPRIDAFAQQATLFSSVVSPVPLTLPAHCSMLTGTIPPYHGVHDNTHSRLDASNATLAGLLGEHGYRTAAVIGAMVLESQTGLDQGFETYDEELPAGVAATAGRAERRAADVTHSAVRWLDQRQGAAPFFLFLHYFDPHHPYVPPEPFASRFAGDPYSGEIAYTDQHIGEVLDKLKQMDLYDSSLIIITGDHGEGLGEHREPAHGYFIYHSTTKVPLLIKLPGRSRPARIDQTVALIDIAPTILRQLGLPLPTHVQGQDLTPYITGKGIAAEERYLYSESMTATRFGCSSLLGIETQDWKYIQAPRPELYHVAADPGELHNLVAEYPARVGHLQTKLRSMLEQHRRDRTEETRRGTDPVALARLQALGYVGGAITEVFEFETDQPDPKDFAETYWKIQQFTQLANLRRNDEARAIAAEILDVKPDIADVHARLAQIGIQQRDMDAVITHQAEALRLEPDSPNAAQWHNNLGAALTRKRRPAEAVEHYGEALLLHARSVPRSDKTDPSASARRQTEIFLLHLNLGNALSSLGRFQEAVGEYQEAINIRPDHAHAHHRLAMALSNLGRDDEAAEEYRKATQLDPRIGSGGP